MIKALTIFGKNYQVTKEATSIVQINEDRVSIPWNREITESLLTEFLSDLLFGKLEEIHREIKKEGKINLLGDLDFEIVKKIDNKKERIAKLKGNRIILQLGSIALPEDTLRYIMAHEIAHIENKRHTRKFWKTVELMCPNYREARQQLVDSGMNLLEH